MPEALEISLFPERLDEGSPEERAAFGMFTICAAQASLTEGFDFYLKGLRAGPLVSGYHVAEWFAWNWWRLRWEPRSAAPDWAFAHEMTSIGEGYVWPNVTIFSDGVRTAIISKKSSRPDAKPFRYVGASPLIVPSTSFESALDAFIPRVLGRLREQSVGDTNLDRLWSDLLIERADPDIAKRRRLEALLGREPDEASDESVERLLADGGRLGEAALDEIAAAAAAGGGGVVSADRLEQIAGERGKDAHPRDAVSLRSEFKVSSSTDTPAWRIGADAARALRKQENLGFEPISNRRLTSMAGTVDSALTTVGEKGAPFAFALDDSALKGRIVLRSKWETGRRFELARLLGDRLIGAKGALHPATQTFTYRQKAQRSFAAELLSPFASVEDMLAGDYSLDRQEDVAEHFAVSPMTINTLLKNHGRIDRDDSDFDFVALAA